MLEMEIKHSLTHSPARRMMTKEPLSHRRNQVAKFLQSPLLTRSATGLYLKQTCFTLGICYFSATESFRPFLLFLLRLSPFQLVHPSSYFPRTTVSGRITTGSPRTSSLTILPQDLLPLAAGSPHHVQLHPCLYSCLLRLARL